MVFFRNLPIARKMAIAFGVISVLCIILGTICLKSLSAIHESTVDLATNRLPSVRALGNIRLAVSNVRRAELNFTSCKTPECVEHYRAERKEYLEELEGHTKEYLPLISLEIVTEREKADKNKTHSFVALVHLSLSLILSKRERENLS